MFNRPTVLNFSGNDSAGFAGLAMDVRTQQGMGVHSASVITANTAQNNQEVTAINSVECDVLFSQIEAVLELPINAIKVGLLTSTDQLLAIKSFVEKKNLPLVLDTVLGSSSGANFIDEWFVSDLKDYLLCVASLVTPNIHEAEKLTDISIQSHDDIKTAADALLSEGVNAVLIKGGHFDSGDLVQDFFTDGKRSFWLSNKKIDTENTRGTGCCLSSAIASSLALGYSLYDAVVIGKMAVSQGLRDSYALNGDNNGPVNVNHFPDQQIDLPYLSLKPLTEWSVNPFPECNDPLLGLYPIVDRANWILQLASSGITTAQLRIKDLEGKDLESEIQLAIEVSNELNIRLFINDYWQLAIKYNAYGVHLGQEDLDVADVKAIHAAGLRFGTSTHCHYEVARAHTYSPSYIACGPVYHTTTKDMPWIPHGLEGLRYWQNVLHYPLVAIGGINQERFDDVAKCQVDSVAMITAITLAEEPVKVAKDFQQRFHLLAKKVGYAL